MGQLTSLMTSSELTSSASSSKSQRRNSKKSRDATKVQKAEDVPLYKGGCSVDELVEYIHNGRDPTKNNVSDNNTVLATQRCTTVLAPVVSSAERREQPPPPALLKHSVKKKMTSKKDPTESDSGCGDCITADHQKDLLNSVDVQPLSCVAALDDIATVTPAVISLLDTVRCDVGALYEGNAADYDIETYTYDNLSSFVPSTEDEFMIVQRRRKGGARVAIPTNNDAKSRRSLGKSRLNCDDGKRTASQSCSTAAIHDDALPISDAVAAIDATFSSLESVSSYASANSSVRSISPLELYSSDTVQSIDVSVGEDNFASSSPRIIDDFYQTTGATDVLNPASAEQVPASHESSTNIDDVEISNDQRVFDSICSTETFCFFAADEHALGVCDSASSSVRCPIGIHAGNNKVTSASLITATDSSTAPTVELSVADDDDANDKLLQQKNVLLPYNCFERLTTPWSGLDEFCAVESEYKFLPSSRQTTIWSYEFAFGSIDFAPYASRSGSILPLPSRRSKATKRSERRTCKRSVSKLHHAPLSSCSRPIRFSTRVAKFPDDSIVIRFGFNCDALAHVHATPTTTPSTSRASTKASELYDDDCQSNVNLRDAVVGPRRAPHRVFPERRSIKRTNSSQLTTTDRYRNYYASHGSSSPSLSYGSRTSVVQSEKVGLVKPTSSCDVRVVSSRRPLASLRQSGSGVGHHRVYERCMMAVRSSSSTSQFDLLEAQNYFFMNYEITRKDVLLGRTDFFVYSSQNLDTFN